MASCLESSGVAIPSPRSLAVAVPIGTDFEDRACLDLFRDAITEITPNLRWNFTAVATLRRRLQRYAAHHQHGTTYISVSAISEETLDTVIAPLRAHNVLRVWWESEIRGAIIKLMPSAHHEFSASRFLTNLTTKVLEIPGHDQWSLDQVGATRFHVPGRRSKEGDGGVRCSTRVGANAWPNLMIEVGFSQTLRMLQIDAQWWLEASGGLARMVIIIQVSANPNSMHFEAWELLPNNRRITRVSRPNIPTRTKTYSNDIDATGIASHNQPLNIPYGVLFDVPHANQVDIQFTADDLLRISQRVFIASQ